MRRIEWNGKGSFACPRQRDRNGTRWFSGERRLVKSVFTVFYYVGLQYTARRETIYLIAEFYEPNFELFGVENWITEEANSRLLENFSSYGNLMNFLKFSFPQERSISVELIIKLLKRDNFYGNQVNSNKFL